ncbi:MAG: Ig-like domain-containing protein [Prevotella sp.]|nr:Ig-like domain-containing protein [Prevotella sp.]
MNIGPLEFDATGTLTTPTVTPATGLSSTDYTAAWTPIDNDLIHLDSDGEYIIGSEKGSVEVEYKVTPTEANATSYREVSKTFTIKIVDPNAGNGSEEKPYSVSELTEAIDEGTVTDGTECYVTGIVSEIGSFDSTTKGITYWISDDGTTTGQFQIYKGKGLNGADFSAATDIETGALVTVKGNVSISGLTVNTLDGSEIVQLTQRTKVNITSFSADETTLVVNDETSTTVANDVPAWTANYSYSSDNEDVAMVDEDGVIYAVAKGTATITVTPNIAANDANYRVGETKTVEITVNNPSYTASFSVNGVIDEANNSVTEQGEAITFPANPATIGSKSFVGWMKGEGISGTTNTAPTLYIADNMGSANVTYYAVFAAVTANEVTDELNLSFTGVSGTSYSSWSNKKGTSGAVYAGQSAGGNSSIQLRSKESNSGIVSTTSGGKLKKVTVVWNSNTADARVLDVYGANTAYTAATNLYSTSTQGTKLGSIAKASATELTIEGDYTYIGLRSNSDAMYLTSISVTWDASTYSGYCTSVKEEVSVAATGFSTYVNADCALDFENTGITAYVVKANNAESVTLEAKTSVAAGEPVLLYANGGATVNVPVIATATATDGNLLVAGTGERITYTDTTPYYVLSTEGGVTGFYCANNTLVPEGKAYLNAGTAGARFFALNLDGETTGIGAALIDNGQLTIDNAVYNLNGQRVTNPAKGLYIVNGRKVVVK